MLKKLFLVVIFLLSNNLFAQTPVQPTGSGTSIDPYLILSLDNLAWLQYAANSTKWNAYYKQTANIDASSTSAWNTSAGFSPIGNCF